MWREFREFAIRGNVVDLAVGSFSRRLHDNRQFSGHDIIMPPLGLLIGGIDFAISF